MFVVCLIDVRSSSGDDTQNPKEGKQQDTSGESYEKINDLKLAATWKNTNYTGEKMNVHVYTYSSDI